MYVLCDNMRPLSDSFFCRGSFLESVFAFRRYFPFSNSVNVYRDLCGSGNLSDLQYICTLNERNFLSLERKFKGSSGNKKGS